MKERSGYVDHCGGESVEHKDTPSAAEHKEIALSREDQSMVDRFVVALGYRRLTDEKAIAILRAAEEKYKRRTKTPGS